ncbi:ABC transporter ATP-binding protein [Lutispora thermophila]|uniref:Iron complex transport system ATP-binding protein n=1 Tax=Lutispora thermophila DSM 19022 TaxID=1122184 RepID=A0A1M6HZX5_9FIRM|nr:ABC transporter ATP-binding protein [Lutispora thermophila]SHJ27778.1 iron complex transport system ATP-binding protein [Lutispora thermophila DSM 19022]
MLSVNHIFCGYNNQDIIKDISFDVEAGCNLSIIGPNGCGKSTLLKAIAHIIPYRGSIKIGETEISETKRKDLAKNIALMTQINSIHFPYTVYETVSLGRYCHMDGMLPRLSSLDKDIIYDSMEKVGLLSIRNAKINQLSGSQLQRVFLAKIFAQDPKIILLDEPTNHLDLRYQIELLEYIKQWKKKKERAVVTVLHDLNLVQEYADKVILLNNGEKFQYGAIKDILSNKSLEEVYKIDIKKWMTKVMIKWQA